MKIKEGMMVFDKSKDTLDDEIFLYGLVTSITGNQVYCLWAKTLEKLKKKEYSYEKPLWTDISNLNILNNSLKSLIGDKI